jgi:polar amino acid transport system substrate-binding protein
MRRLIVAMGAAVVVAGGLSACGTSSSSSVSVSAPGASASSCTKPGINKLLFKPNVLTVATDTPAYTPWFVSNMPVKCIS